jgi:SWI/SNF-related matrix-associated actin-dependent regulator 1 of chromatin subfamily A
MGTILVPSSSPLAPEVNQLPYQPYGQSHSYDVATTSGLISSNTWDQPRRKLNIDPLSAPSGFQSNGVAVHASLRRPWSAGEGQIERTQEDGPPRKRLNRGPHYDSSHDAYDFANSPPSPAIQRPGQRRRIVSNSMDNLSYSSDDSLPDVTRIVAGSSKARIMKGRPSSPDASPTNDPTADPKFIRFKVTMPLESPARIHNAWIQAKGDVKRATELLSDPSWVAPKKLQDDITGRVKEIDEATKAQRMAAKAKGKKSMIYANRPVLDTKPSTSTPPTSKRVIDLTAPSPAPIGTPLAPPVRRKRVKKLVVNSDSEAAFQDSDDDGDERSNKRGRPDITNETRALDYFNTAGAEALQELTGMICTLSCYRSGIDFCPPTGCSPKQANAIIGLRPFESVDDLNTKLGQGRKKIGPTGISPRMFEDCQAIFEGYGEVDSILEDCEQIGADLRAAIATWTITPTVGKGKAKEEAPGPPVGGEEDGALSFVSFSPSRNQKPKDYLLTQPTLLSDTVRLKDYQLLGVNWLHLLYRSNLSCILADEMGMHSLFLVVLSLPIIDSGQVWVKPYRSLVSLLC